MAGVETRKTYTTEIVVRKNVTDVTVSWESMTGKMQIVKAHNGSCGCIFITVRRALRLYLLAAWTPPCAPPRPSVLAGIISGKIAFPKELPKMPLMSGCDVQAA